MRWERGMVIINFQPKSATHHRRWRSGLHDRASLNPRNEFCEATVEAHSDGVRGEVGRVGALGGILRRAKDLFCLFDFCYIVVFRIIRRIR